MKLPRPYWYEYGQILYQGSVQERLADLPAEFVNCVITSPPYFGLRNYGVDGQIGLEASPSEYVEVLRKVFKEIERVLDPRGTVWLNIGDSYSSTGGTQGVGPNATVGSTLLQAKERTRPRTTLPSKNMLGIPWRIAFALQDDGWILRNDIIWHKPNAMPSSVTDRLSNRYEHIFLFSKSTRYDFDLDAIREPLLYPHTVGHTFGGTRYDEILTRGRSTYDPHRTPPGTNPQTFGPIGERNGRSHPLGKNPGDMWSISTTPYRGAHFATFPPKLVERCMLAGSAEGGVVLDPFCGSGTVGMVARRLARRSIGIDLNSDYLDLAAIRIEAGK